MSLLVTGAHGFVGSHVVKLLNDEVLTPTKKELDLMDVDGLFNYCQVNRVTTIIHLAAMCGGIGVNKEHPGLFMHQNLQMGINVLEAARKSGVKKIIMLGTVCSYPKNTQVPFKEEDIWNGYPEETNAPYGIAKKAVMELGVAYEKEYGIEVVNLIPVNMAGENDNFDEFTSHVVPAIIKKFEYAKLNNEKHITLWGSGSASREFMYAGDCAKAIVSCIDSSVGSQPINLGTGREYKISQLANCIRDIGGYSDIDIIWDKTKPDGQPRRCLDTSRAKKLIGWSASTELDELIKRTIDWYRREG